MRPLISEGVQPRPVAPPASRVRAFLLQTWTGRVLCAALLIWLLDGLLGLAGGGLPWGLSAAGRVVRWLFAAGFLLRGALWLSDRLLWRIRTKLLLSYLFIALVPVVLLTVFFVTAGVLLLLVSASRLVTVDVDRVADACRAAARAALVDLPPGDEAARRAVHERLASIRDLQPATAWTLFRARRVVAAEGGAPRELPAWWKGEPYVSLVRQDAEAAGPDRPALRLVVAEADAVLVLDVPADARFFADLEQRTGIHVLQPEETGAKVVVNDGRTTLELKGGRTRQVSLGGRSGGLAFVALHPRRDWTSGEAAKDAFEPLVFRFHPLEYVRRLSPEVSRDLGEFRSLSDVLILAMGIVGLVFLVMYAFALSLGLLLARSITRGVHDLSLGTQRLLDGDFDHVIRVRSRDQLGELADSFNHMSQGLKQLMAEQLEKERLEEELRIARQIQMSLLPGQGLVRLAGVRIAALCLPAAEVGGDYYDLLPLGPTRMGLLVADVSGKGTSAALYMAELKGLVLSLSRIYDSPARLLGEANRILAANMDSRSFVTMTYAVIDTAALTMRYARAGHNPMLHLDAASGRTRVLAPAGLGLGLDSGARFEKILEEQTVPLRPGDFFLFFTDGLSEAMNASSELFGEGRLRSILEDSEGLGTEELKQRILDEVRLFVGTAAPHDDMTLVVLKVVPEAQAA